MPEPQFLTPQPVSQTRQPRRFTLQQANKSLPLVRRIVGDIVLTHAHATELQTRLAAVSGSKEQQLTQRELDTHLAHLHEYLDEIKDIGCELKDFRIGLVDFVARHQHRDVYLCWRLGEDAIHYFHEMDGGYAARQPVTLLEESD